MCLEYRQDLTERFREQNPVGRVVSGFKIFLSPDGEHLESSCRWHTYTPGRNAAMSGGLPVPVELSDHEIKSRQIEFGIHVMLSEEGAEGICDDDDGEFVVPVSFLASDVRAVGLFNDSECAVVTAIEIDPKVYAKSAEEAPTPTYGDDDDDGDWDDDDWDDDDDDWDDDDEDW